MEQDNIDELIEQTIKERSIEPSSYAKKRLIVALNSKPKDKKIIWLSYAAAAIIILGLFITVSDLAIKNSSIENFPKVIVEIDSVSQKSQKTPVSNTHNKSVVLENESNIDEDKLNINKSNVITKSKKSLVNNQLQKPNTKLYRHGNNIQVKPLDIPKNNTLFKNAEIASKAIVHKNIEEKEYSNQSLFISAETLLASVEEDSIGLIKTKKLKSKSYIRPDALLVEMERQLFEEENAGVFKKVKKKIKKIKEAVAARNYKQ